MKLLITLILCIVFTSLVAQKQKATLVFKDGTELKGYARINLSNEIKFRKDKNSAKELYNSSLVKALTIRVNDIDKEYHYMVVESNLRTRLLELVKSGNVTLYRNLKQGYSPGTPNTNGIGFYGGHNYSISDYYVIKQGDEYVNHLGTKGSIFSKNFKKAASDYFKDCPTLVEKINNKEFKKRDIVEIVEFYNEDCN